ncbi:uncharacterized protein LOC132549202 [Ylistrum balloti]|uniref:uncharacterized protein LOC132549202 n=1 Tax=Ylistrum balloti TaxID=509963 RepID=UPI00290598B7|nr:uncharacterized protein LOC132549202 [Ylistrum balloti]
MDMKKTLTEGDIFTFRCNVSESDALDLFSNPLKYFFRDQTSGNQVKISENRQIVDASSPWRVDIHPNSTSSFFLFELSGMVNMESSGTYYCTRKNVNNSVILTVRELTQDVKTIDFSISALDEFGVPAGEEFIVTRLEGQQDPEPKVVHIDSGYYQAICNAEEGIPKPRYVLKSGNADLAFEHMKKVLLNSATSDLSCHVENGEFAHHLKFLLMINAGHPEMDCSSPTVATGEDAEFDCLVTGKNLKCDHFSWISELDGSPFNNKANYTVDCQVQESGNSMINVLKFKNVMSSDFDEGYILKFENHLDETFQTVNKLKKKKKMEIINSATTVVPFGMMSLLFLSVLGLIL